MLYKKVVHVGIIFLQRLVVEGFPQAQLDWPTIVNLGSLTIHILSAFGLDAWLVIDLKQD